LALTMREGEDRPMFAGLHGVVGVLRQKAMSDGPLRLSDDGDGAKA